MLVFPGTTLFILSFNSHCRFFSLDAQSSIDSQLSLSLLRELISLQYQITIEMKVVSCCFFLPSEKKNVSGETESGGYDYVVHLQIF